MENRLRDREGDEVRRQTDAFGLIATGLASENIAVRLATVHYAFSAMDEHVLRKSSDSTSFVQAVLDVLMLQFREESAENDLRKPANLRTSVKEAIVRLLGARLSVDGQLRQSRLEGNSAPTTHYFSPLKARVELDRPKVSIVAAGLNLDHLRLDKVNLEGMNLTESSLQYSIISGADLSFCWLDGVSAQNLTIDADLSHSKCSQGDFSFAAISARVKNARFQGVDYQHSDCCFQDVEGATFLSCDFRGADLSSSDPAINLDRCVVDADTRLPNGCVADIPVARRRM